MEVDPLPMRPRTIARVTPLVALIACTLMVTSLTWTTPVSAANRCRGVRVTPGDDVQATINEHTRRTTFCFADGVYNLTATIWTDDKFPTLNLKSGAIIDGQNGGFTGISGLGASDGRSGTVILGGTFQHFGNPNGDAWAAPVILSARWIVKGSEFRENFNSGLAILGDRARVSKVYTHHNGRYGLTVAQPCVGCAAPKGVIIEGSEIAHNNTRQLDPGYDAGGTKFSAGTQDMIVRRNEIHDNYGSGVWFDSFHEGARVYRNVIYDNYRWGIFWEASYGGVKIHNNSLSGNGVGDGSANAFNAQIAIVDSDGGARGIEVYDNRIAGGAHPVALIDDSNRSGATRSVFVHDNVMTLRGNDTRVGGFGVDLFSSQAKNRFEHNTYRVPDRGGAYWTWNGETLTWHQWRALGHDDGGALRLTS